MEKFSSIVGEVESQVRSYCRKFPVEFSKARNSELFAKDGTRYIDFLDVAGSMNYGHNNPYIKRHGNIESDELFSYKEKSLCGVTMKENCLYFVPPLFFEKLIIYKKKQQYILF